MTKIKAIIFDLDGVIVDTARFHYIAWKNLANELGFDFTEKDNERLKGVSRMTSLDILLKIGNIKIEKEKKYFYAEQKNQCYVEYINTMTPQDILPGVKNFLTKVKEEGYKIALGSASKNARTILIRVGLIDFFDSIIDGNKVTNAKPDPEIFLKAASELNVKPNECIVFEDAVAGVEAAIAGGMYCIGVGSEEILSKANFVIPDFKEMNIEKFKKHIDTNTL